MEEVAKHLGDIGTFGIFALAVVWMVLKYGLPALRNGKSKDKTEAQPAQPASPQPHDTGQFSTVAAHLNQCADMLRDIHRWQQEKPVVCATDEICREIKETRETLCNRHNETDKSLQQLREKVIEWAARSRKDTKV